MKEFTAKKDMRIAFKPTTLTTYVKGNSYFIDSVGYDKLITLDVVKQDNPVEENKMHNPVEENKAVKKKRKYNRKANKHSEE